MNKINTNTSCSIFLFLILTLHTMENNSCNVHSFLQSLSLDQKIGQLFMVAAVADEEINKDFILKWQKPYRMDKEYIEQLINKYHIGGIIYLGISKLKKQIKRTAHFQQLSKIPLLIGQDLEPGRVGASRLPGFFNFPSNESLSQKSDEVIFHLGATIGKICKQLGVHINFAPVVDVNNNPNNPVINDRSFGADKKNVTKKALAFSRGLESVGIIPCIKHFPGHGDTSVDSHFDLPVIAHETKRLHDIELYPFKKLIKKKIPAIMIAHLSVPAFEKRKNRPSSLSYEIVTNMLQKELGFDGLIIPDGLDMRGVTKYFNNGEAELEALLAGNDILLCPVNVPEAVKKIKQAIYDGIITERDIDKHVIKILKVKEQIFSNMPGHL